MALLVALMLGTFIWFVATWSPEDNPSLTFHHQQAISEGTNDLT
jgi:hypothetical protein